MTTTPTLATRLASWRCELAEAAETIDEAESHYKEAIEADDTFVAAYTALANLYIENRRFLEATALLQDAYGRFGDDEDLAVAYYMSMRRQGLTPESIRMCKEILEKHPENDFVKSEMAVALVMSGNAAEALALWEEDGFKPTLRWQEWLPVAYHAVGRFDDAMEASKGSVSLNEYSKYLKLLYLRSQEMSSPSEDIKTAYDRFVRDTGCSTNPVWMHFELLRHQQPEAALDVLGKETDVPLAIEPIAWCPRGVGRSSVHYDLQQIEDAKKTYVQPIVKRDSLAENIRDFRAVCQELIDAGKFTRFTDIIEKVKDRYWPEGNDPTYVMSTGRCGTLALHKFMQRSKRVMSFHTMHWQLIPPDRNHTLYRIFAGKFDKEAMVDVLTGYLENRIPEFAWAYQDQRTPVMINHWDTVFSPFIAQLFPNSQFLHMWRAETKVFESIYGKNQFQNEQLRHCWYDPAFPDGQFNCFFDQNLDMVQQITWYLFMTKQYSWAFMDTLEDRDRMITMTSEQLFTRDEDSFNDVKRIAHLVDLSYDDFCDAYARPVNQKTERRQAKKDDVSEISKRVPDLMAQLEKDGFYKQEEG